ncbi:hypothetical protein HF086_011606 [Spodoptera exigua]|uniref:Uncharacterized protein n=1 Tax=Spodoptera exigua TaxID=7107 RepID=A0A922MCS4_SPOEX|nr:hypothetical protein HF086_011606 [Spodoptera exigua]
MSPAGPMTNPVPEHSEPPIASIEPENSTQSSTAVDPEIPTISSEVLLALGDLMPEKPVYGPPVNSDLARIWSNILKSGLLKETKQKLMEQLIPENVPLLKAPKLNPEISASVSDNIVSRDKKIEFEQNQLGIGLSIISNAISVLINNDSVDRLKLISLLSDAGRILTDLHLVQTKSRRNLIFPVIDKKFYDAIKDVERDEYIYGVNLTDKIKVLKTCQQSGQSIKKPTFNQHNNKANHKGNSQGPPRYNQRTPARYGPKKHQSSIQARKHHGHYYQSTTKKTKTPQEKPPART